MQHRVLHTVQILPIQQLESKCLGVFLGLEDGAKSKHAAKTTGNNRQRASSNRETIVLNLNKEVSTQTNQETKVYQRHKNFEKELKIAKRSVIRGIALSELGRQQLADMRERESQQGEVALDVLQLRLQRRYVVGVESVDKWSKEGGEVGESSPHQFTRILVGMKEFKPHHSLLEDIFFEKAMRSVDKLTQHHTICKKNARSSDYHNE